MFYKPVDKRSRAAMVAFLDEHFEYEGSFAHNVQIHRLGIPDELQEIAYASRVFYTEYEAARNFEQMRSSGRMGLGVRFAGRGGGHIKLVHTSQEELGYKSVCSACGALNYDEVWVPPEEVLPIIDHLKLNKPSNEPVSGSRFTTYKTRSLIDYWLPRLLLIDNRCGRCGKPARHNLDQPRYQTLDHVYKKPDRCVLEDMPIGELRGMVTKVQDFDRCVDLMREEFICRCQAVASGKRIEEVFDYLQKVIS